MRWPWTRRPYTALASLDAIAESAVALAIDPDYGPSLKMEAMPDGSTRTSIEADNFVLMKTKPDIAIVDPSELAIRESKPEYHLGLSKRMVSAFDASEAKILADMETESDRHSKLMADLTMELDDVRRVRAAYVKVGEVLGDTSEITSTVGAEEKPPTPRRRKPAAATE